MAKKEADNQEHSDPRFFKKEKKDDINPEIRKQLENRDIDKDIDQTEEEFWESEIGGKGL